MGKFLSLLKQDVSQTRRKLGALDRYELLLCAAIIIYIFYFTLVSFLRFDNFYTGMLDLGNMTQAVWNTTQGRILAVTDPSNAATISRFATHGDFFLAFLAPLYAIWPNPKLLLFLQTVVLSLGAVFVYKISVHVLQERSLSLIFAIAFLLNPSVQRSNLYDFHAVVLATTFLLAAFYFMKIRRYGWFLLFTFLAGSTKEQVWAITGIFGLFIAIRAFYSLRVAASKSTQYLKREILFGIVVAIVSFTALYAFFSIIIPGFKGTEHFASAYLAEYGNNTGSIVTGIASAPNEVVGTISDVSRRTYIRQLFLPLAYLSIFSPLYLVFAFPELFINLLSANQNMHQIYYQYTATITPFLFIAAIYGVRLLRYFIPRLKFSFFVFLITISTIYCAYLYGPLPFARDPNTAMFAERPQASMISSYLQTIPEKATVSASNQLGSHLSARKTITTLPVGADKADYVLFLLSDTSAMPTIQSHRDLSDVMKNNSDYILIHEEGEFLVFKRNRLSSFLY